MHRLAEGQLVLATHNAGKLREVAELLAPWGFEVVSAGALGLPEPAETEDSFLGNARIKALAAARASGLPALADDSGFSVAALDGARRDIPPGAIAAALPAVLAARDLTRLAAGRPVPAPRGFGDRAAVVWAGLRGRA